LSGETIRVILIVAGMLGALAAVLAWRRPRPPQDEAIGAMEAWLERFSVDSYRPMLRLADGRDASFLAACRGSEEAARYRRLQRRMLKQFLHDLSLDYHRLHRVATYSAPSETHDRGNSSPTPLEEKMEFNLSMWSIEIRLLLSEIAPCVINPRPVLANIDELAARTRQIIRRRHQFRVS
jgi:hypothetical protein